VSVAFVLTSAVSQSVLVVVVRRWASNTAGTGAVRRIAIGLALLWVVPAIVPPDLRGSARPAGRRGVAGLQGLAALTGRERPDVRRQP
jgi:hypothetical protein